MSQPAPPSTSVPSAPPSTVPPPYQPPAVPIVDATTSIVAGNSFMTVVQRSAMVFVFWFAIVVIFCLVFNEVVVSDYMRGLSRDDEERELDEEKGLPDPEYERFRFENHQIISMATTFGMLMVVTRIVLESICSWYGREVCSILSGQTMITTTIAAAAPPSDRDDRNDRRRSDDRDERREEQKDERRDERRDEQRGERREERREEPPRQRNPNINPPPEGRGRNTRYAAVN
jgi:hypothetical protein